MRIDHCAVTCGKELGLSDHLQAHLGADAAAARATGQAAGGQPLGCLAAGANKAGSCLELFCLIKLAGFTDLNGCFPESSYQDWFEMPGPDPQYKRSFRPALP